MKTFVAGLALALCAQALPLQGKAQQSEAYLGLRDYLAGQALMGLTSGSGSTFMSERGTAIMAYQYADAMMEVRNVSR